VNDFLPALPAATGPALASAGLVTEANRASKVPGGPASKGLPGDYFLQNDKIRLLIQAPGRFAETLGFGGNPINLDFVRAPGEPGETQFGELGPFLNDSHTVNFTRIEVVRDGASGGPAVLRAYGHTSVLDYFNLGGFVAGLGLLKFDATTPPPVDVAATYILLPGATNVRIIYTLYNPTPAALPLAIGSFTDTGGEVEYFAPGVGFGEAAVSDIGRIIASAKPLDYWVGQSPKSAFAVLPASAGVANPVQNVGLGIKGLGVCIYDSPSLLDAFAQTNFVVPAKAGRSFETYLLLGADAGDVHAQVLKLRGKVTGTLRGRVVSAGAGVADARISLMDTSDTPLSVYVSKADGSFGGELEPGTYKLVADKVGWLRSPDATVTITAGSTVMPELVLPPTARLPFTISDGAGNTLAAKLSFVGTDPSPPDGRFRDVTKDPLARGLARVAYTWRGSSERDGVLEMEPGSYRVVVTHGNEFTRYDAPLELIAGDNPRLTVTLRKVVETPGYLACDFHQHSVNSPDSPTPLRERIVTYLAAGVELIASSDHDYLTDYGPVISEMGVGDLLGSMVGVETTSFDYGHFNAFPLRINPNAPDRGAIDWGGGEASNLSPGRIFASMRAAGAQVVQVNHVRSPTAATRPLSSFQQYFDRAALTFDLSVGAAFGDEAEQPVSNEILRIALDEPLWSDDFDTMELYNGFQLRDYDGDGEVDEETVELVMRDWFNFLSIGKVITPVGNTDSHERWSDSVDAPRTYVRVPDDSRPGAVREADVIAGLKTARDTIVTNGPFLTLHVNGDARPAMGRLTPVSGDTVDLTVKVQAPTWMDLRQVKIFANNTYRIPPPGPTPDAMSPRAVVRLSENPAAGEARLVRRTVAEGAERFEAEVELRGFPLPDAGRDTWIVATVRGTKSLYPFIPNGIPADAPLSQLVDGTYSGGVFPLAITAAAFLDRDGNGRYDAPKRR
jgi:hypothetical protein